MLPMKMLDIIRTCDAYIAARYHAYMRHIAYMQTQASNTPSTATRVHASYMNSAQMLYDACMHDIEQLCMQHTCVLDDSI